MCRSPLFDLKPGTMIGSIVLEDDAPPTRVLVDPVKLYELNTVPPGHSSEINHERTCLDPNIHSDAVLYQLEDVDDSHNGMIVVLQTNNYPTGASWCSSPDFRSPRSSTGALQSSERFAESERRPPLQS